MERNKDVFITGCGILTCALCTDNRKRNQKMNETTKKPFDPSKPVQTRDGRPARVHATDMCGEHSILATRWNDSAWIEHRCTKEGICWVGKLDHNLDLINVPPPKVKRDFWLNIPSGDWGKHYAYDNENAARKAVAGVQHCWKTVKVTAEYEPFEDA